MKCLGHASTSSIVFICYEDYEDTKVVIRIRISKNNRKHTGQKKKYQNNDRRITENTMDKRKSTNNDLQNIHIKLKIE